MEMDNLMAIKFYSYPDLVTIRDVLSFDEHIAMFSRPFEIHFEDAS